MIEGGLEKGLRSFGQRFTVLEQEVAGELSLEERKFRKEVAAELAQAEKILEKVRLCLLVGRVGVGVIEWGIDRRLVTVVAPSQGWVSRCDFVAHTPTAHTRSSCLTCTRV